MPKKLQTIFKQDQKARHANKIDKYLKHWQKIKPPDKTNLSNLSQKYRRNYKMPCWL